MRAKNAMSVCVIVFLSAVACAQTQKPVSKETHDRALAVLHEAMTQGKEWVKIHAAESLLWTGNPKGVADMFRKETETAPPKYRIGVWRVLAQAIGNEDEKRLFTDRIAAAFLDVNGPDRIHAAETLGKLGYVGKDPEFRRVGEQEKGSFQACARWCVANSGTEEDERFLAALLDSPDSDARGCTAYAFRFFKKIRPETLRQLEAAAKREPADSVWRANLLSTWYMHVAPADRPAVKTLLAPYAENGSVDAKREVCAVFGRVPDPVDVPLLTKLLDDTDLDVRAGAAEALLRIERDR